MKTIQLHKLASKLPMTSVLLALVFLTTHQMWSQDSGALSYAWANDPTRVKYTTVPTGGSGIVKAYSEADDDVRDQTVTVDGVVVKNPDIGGPIEFAGGVKLPYISQSVKATLGNKKAGDSKIIDSVSTGNTAPKKPNGYANGNAAETVLQNNTTILATLALVRGNYVAGAEARDPLYFGAGPNTITETINPSLFAGPGSFGAATQIGMRRDAFGLGNLFTLSIFAPGGLTSTNDLIIDFTSSGLGWDDKAIADALRLDFTVSDNTATLKVPFELTFSLDSPVPYSLDFYDESAAAAENDGSTVVPEPSSLFLLGSGILGLAGVLRKRMIT